MIAKESKDSLILLDVESGEYYTLNETGAAVWKLCDGTRDADEIALRISESYEIDIAEAVSDVTDILQQLTDESLVSAGRL